MEACTKIYYFVYLQPSVSLQRQFPTPELLIDLIYVFWGHLFESTIDFPNNSKSRCF